MAIVGPDAVVLPAPLANSSDVVCADPEIKNMPAIASVVNFKQGTVVLIQ